MSELPSTDQTKLQQAEEYARANNGMFFQNEIGTFTMKLPSRLGMMCKVISPEGESLYDYLENSNSLVNPFGGR
jgi:hypothetical protein